jgi:2-oxo-3-hexenedioate decarboxylase
VGFAEPRIEPEIVFKLALAPTLGMDETALLDCVDWVAHGFEIVQSIFPGWKFSAPDTVAAFGLHGALLIGPRHSIAAHAEDWSRTLSTSEIEAIGRIEPDGPHLSDKNSLRKEPVDKSSPNGH